MYKVLRIIFCVISALCIAACPFVFIHAGVVWGICDVVASVTFAVLTILFRNFQRDKEESCEEENSGSDETPQN